MLSSPPVLSCTGHATRVHVVAMTRSSRLLVRAHWATGCQALATGTKALPFGSDFPTVGTVPPLLGIYAAVTREDLQVGV